MRQNINVAIFSRMNAVNKVNMVNALTSSEIKSVTYDTILRCVKEVGYKDYTYKTDKDNNFVKKYSRDKRLNLSNEREAGNGWNSTIYGVDYCKGKLFVRVYFQMDDTDRTLCVPFNEFFAAGEYHGKAFEMNRYGDNVPRYFRYDEDDKVNVLKNLLLEYLHKKYADKLAKTA